MQDTCLIIEGPAGDAQFYLTILNGSTKPNRHRCRQSVKNRVAIKKFYKNFLGFNERRRWPNVKKKEVEKLGRCSYDLQRTYSDI
jgi:hypothetical protein